MSRCPKISTKKLHTISVLKNFLCSFKENPFLVKKTKIRSYHILSFSFQPTAENSKTLPCDSQVVKRCFQTVPKPFWKCSKTAVILIIWHSLALSCFCEAAAGLALITSFWLCKCVFSTFLQRQQQIHRYLLMANSIEFLILFQIYIWRKLDCYAEILL